MIRPKKMVRRTKSWERNNEKHMVYKYLNDAAGLLFIKTNKIAFYTFRISGWLK